MLTRVQAFEELRSNLELTGLQEKTVAWRQANVRAAVARQLTVTDDFLTGSYRRQTLISPLKQADVDVMMVLDRSYRERGPRAVLDLVRRALLAEYQTPKTSRSGQAVTITFSDFSVDVVPAFRLPWWHWREGWEICDSGRDAWIVTDPTAHVALSTKANGLHDGNLVPLVKELKAWNRTVGRPLRSFHLEKLAWAVFGTSWLSSKTIRSDWTAVRYFLKKVPGVLTGYLPDMYGRGSVIGAYLAGDAQDRLIGKLETAHDRCSRAESAFSNGDLSSMHSEYRKVFGDWYPSCGK